MEVLLGYCDKLGITPNELLQVKEDSIPADLKKQIASLSESEIETLSALLSVFLTRNRGK